MSPRRRILEITSYPPPRAGWGVRVEFLKRELLRQGHDCVVLNIGRSRHIPSPEYETVISGTDYLRKVWRFTRSGFVAHVHVNATAATGFALAIAAEVLNLVGGQRCFLTFHAGIDQPYFPRVKRPWLWPMYRILFGVPRTVICNSEPVRQKIAEFGIPLSKIVAIPAFSHQYLAFESRTLKPEIEAFLARTTDVLFSYVRIRRTFNLDVLIDGFAALTRERPQAGLILCGVAGDIDPSLWASLTAQIERYGIKDRIHIIDDLDHDDFMTLLSRASIYVRTPTSDGVASSVLESLHLRVPVVAAENGSRPAGVITYRAKDPQELAETLDKVLRARDQIAGGLPKPEVHDTVQDEVALLTTVG